MKGFDRNVRYSLWWTKKMLLYTYGGSIFLIAWFWLIGTLEIKSVSDIFTAYISMSVYMGTLLILIYTSVNMGTSFYQEISYGCTRKCAAIGIMFGNLFTAFFQSVINLISLFAIHMILGEPMPDMFTILCCACVYVFIIAVSPFAGLAVLFWGRIGYYTVVLAMIGVGSGIIGAGMFILNETGDNIVKYFVQSHLIVAAALIILMLLIVMVTFIFVHITRKVEVRI